MTLATTERKKERKFFARICQLVTSDVVETTHSKSNLKAHQACARTNWYLTTF